MPVDCPTGLNDNATLPNMTMFSNLPLDVYNVTEHIPITVEGTWELTDIVCESLNGNSTFSTPITGDEGGEILITLGADDVATCTFINETDFPTRTQGYWKTHTNVTKGIFLNPPNATDAADVGFTNGTMVIGNATNGKTIDNFKELFGVYYSSIPKKSDASPRSADEQVMMIMLHQLVTAKLNCGAFNCNSTATALINSCDEAYATGNVTEIKNVNSTFPGFGCTEELDWYNNSGETFSDQFPPGATPTDSKMYANMEITQGDFPNDSHIGKTGISRWDDPKPMTGMGLIVLKNVTNDDGGDKMVVDFAPYSIEGQPVSLEVLNPLPGGTDGTYLVAETTNENYTQTFSDECPGGVATVLPEQTVTCTIINDDIGPTLKLEKFVFNGTALSGDWNMTANTTGSNATRDINDFGNSTTFHPVFANVPYDLDESIVANNYNSDDVWSCVDNNNGDAPFATDDDDTVTLGLNDKVTCTITNVADPP